MSAKPILEKLAKELLKHMQQLNLDALEPDDVLEFVRSCKIDKQLALMIVELADDE